MQDSTGEASSQIKQKTGVTHIMWGWKRECHQGKWEKLAQQDRDSRHWLPAKGSLETKDFVLFDKT